jgi:beta-glucosidase
LVQSLQGNYNGPPPNPVYPLAGIEKRFNAAHVVYAMGSSLAEGVAMPIEHTALHPAAGSSEFGLKGEYFASDDLSGTPVLTRVDRNVNFNWDKVIPVNGLQRNNYSVRWSGTFTPPAAGDYRLGVRINYCYSCSNAEGFRFYVDDKLVAQNESKVGDIGAVFDAALHFDNTQPHAIRLEYFHKTGTAGIDLTWQAPADVLRDEAIEQAKSADVIVACVGLSPSLEGEEMPIKLDGFSGGDRTDIKLPAVQEDLLKTLVATGEPVVVVLQNGSALAVNYAAEHAAAILEAWYPGEEGGTAIAATLAGDNNPAGRLPVTFYRSLAQLPPFEDYAMKGRTYRYMTDAPLYPFGYGLSYTTFSYGNVKPAANSVKAGDSVAIQGEVKNTGKAAGDEVVELYLSQPKTDVSPRIALAGFKRVHLAPQQAANVEFTLDPRILSEVDADGKRMVMPGEYKVYFGGAQPLGDNAAPAATFTVSGTVELAK